MTSVASSLPSLDNYPSAFSSFHSSLPSLPPSHYSTAFSSKGVYGDLLSNRVGGESMIDEPPRINPNDFNDSIHNSNNNGGNIGVGDNDNYNYYQGYDNSQNAVGGDLVSDLLLNDPLKSSYTSINLNFDNNETGVFDGHFLSNFTSSSIGNGGTLPSLPSNSLAPPSLNQFTNNHSAFSARISLNNGMLNNTQLLSTNDGDDYHHNAEDLERLQIDLERLNVYNSNGSSFNQSPSLSTLPSLSNLSSATTAGFSSYWSSGYSSSPPSAIAPIDAFYNPSMMDSKKSLQLQQSLQGVHINGVSLNANAPAFSPTHGGPAENGTNFGMMNSLQRSQSEGGVINQQLLLQQQQNQLQRSQLQNALAPLSSSAPATAPNNNPPSQSSPPPTAPSNGASSPSSSNASATVSLSSVAGGLNPSSLLASAESPHALSLLETLLGVSPLATLLTMEDIEKSPQLRCVLLELDRSYKEIVHLKQENMNLQKNIDKCIKVMNLQDVDQYVNSLARIYSNGPQGGNQQERVPKHNNYNKYSSHGGQHHNNNNNNNNNNNAEGTANESEAVADHSATHQPSSGGGNHGGKRVYYGPSSSNFRGGRGGGGGYRGGRGGQRGYSNAPRE